MPGAFLKARLYVDDEERTVTDCGARVSGKDSCDVAFGAAIFSAPAVMPPAPLPARLPGAGAAKALC